MEELSVIAEFERVSEKIARLIDQYSEIHLGELYGSEDKTTEIAFEQGFIKYARTKATKGIGIRLINREGREGTTFTYDFSDEALQKMMINGLKMMKAATPNPFLKELPLPSKTTVQITGLYDKELEYLPLEKISDALTPIFDLKTRVPTPMAISGALDPHISTNYLWNTNGVQIHESGSSVSTYASVGIADRGQNGSGSDADSVTSWNALNVKKVADLSYDMALRGLKKTTVKTGKYPIILSPKAVIGLILRTIDEAIDAETVQNHMSFLGEKLNQSIGSELLTVFDNPHLDSKLGSSLFDAEGTATQPMPIVDKGFLKNYFYNSLTAAKENKHSNGHAARAGLAGAVGIGAYNLLVSAGTSSKQDMLNEIKKGIFFDSTGDEPNIVNGDFSGMISTGYLIQDGQLGASLQETMLGINMLDLFNRIESVSKEIEWHGSHCAPWIKLKSATISSRQ